jgi:hypothetical protein
MALVAFAGCGSDKSAMAPVTGKVTLDGKPFTTGGIATIPVAGRGAMGRINSDGTFELSTFGAGDGALVGTHKVAVAAYEGGSGGPEGSLGKSLIPMRYTSPESSGLTIEVTADGPNEPVLELSSK